TSILVLLINGFLWNKNKTLKLGFDKINLVIVCILLEVFTGILMYYFEFPFLSQPIHLIIASLLFGVQIYIFLEVSYQKKQFKKQLHN
ncbi:MAG: heme A synthase, partial [Bacteroidota bacterium]|nr:heme A synthase [Bacteroidota bacterium]